MEELRRESSAVTIQYTWRRYYRSKKEQESRELAAKIIQKNYKMYRHQKQKLLEHANEVAQK